MNLAGAALDLVRKAMSALGPGMARMAFDSGRQTANAIGEENSLAGPWLVFLLEGLQPIFPWLTLDLLHKGEIPIATSRLEAEVRRRTKAFEWVESLELGSEPGLFTLTIRTQKYLSRHETTFQIVCEDFVISGEEMVARFRCLDEPQIKGLNVLGSLSVGLLESALLRAVHSPTMEGKVADRTGGAVALRWPEAVVQLERVEAMRRVTDSEFLGMRLLDFVRFGPLRIERDLVVLQVEPAGPQESKLG